MVKGLKEDKQKSNLIEIKMLRDPIFGYIILALAIFSVIFGLIILLGDIFFQDSVSSLEFSKGCIAQVDIKGQIISSELQPDIFGGSKGLVSSLEIKNMLEEISKKNDVKAILVVIDSPGGSVLGSQEIYNAIEKIKKPKVSYLREIAASGGYYVALATDYIVAEPSTLTGSIGSRMTLIELTGLFEKIGYNQTNIKSGELKDIGDPSKKPTQREIELLQNLVNETFEEFKQILLKKRYDKLDKTKLDEVYSAAIFSGKQAYKIGLIDEIGDKTHAVKKISEMLNTTKELPICDVEKKKIGILSSLLNSISGLISPKIKVEINIAKNDLEKKLYYQ
ncbi:MAG: signal peptide peptidase SppA [Candidatus Omnitrophica bacterium]|nr:signal peptide peptidase SppA [Candidatus Omnitrophota bacterium]